MTDPSIEIWALDEVHFQRATSLIRTWAVKGNQPKIISASTRQKVGFFGAINIKTGQLLTQQSDVFNAETFHQFLCYLLNRTQGKILLILDNARYHHARDLKPFFTEYKKRFQREFLPPYSPELNPIERIWRITRRKITHNRYFPVLEDLKSAVLSQFIQWEQPNVTLKTLCSNI